MEVPDRIIIDGNIGEEAPILFEVKGERVSLTVTEALDTISQLSIALSLHYDNNRS